ncbi:MAG: hypothetical protein JKY08_02665 [Flavobacteriaceae bacterium]|nr:hypothetical protein [Flavobacteriaceae bacterium]
MELDGLKNIWNKQTTGDTDKISTLEIYKMIHAKSSTTVKWIFIISLIELGLGLVIGVFSAFFDSYHTAIEQMKEQKIYSYFEFTSLIIYVVILCFIGMFFYQYKKISVAANINQLMHTIVNTRKVVRYYILFNLSATGIVCATAMLFGISKGYNDAMIADGIQDPHMPFKIWIFASIIMLVVIGLFILILWYIYKLIYGRLLKKLYKNHQELLEMD